MFARLAAWLEDRIALSKIRDALLLEHIPGGAKWRYVWGSCLSFVFTVQLITGVLLMTAYSPGDSTAWPSVYFIQYQMDFGWFIRGLHHFGSQAMVVLLGLHMLQVVIAGAHLPPREINWWLGLALMGVVLSLGLTGYLLPWDQKGFWATQVATNIAGSLPVLGPWVQKIIVGGPEYGHHTLTRFYALHVGILPPLLIVLLIAHVALFRRRGVTVPKDAVGEGWFWPDQAFRDMVASMAIFALLIVLVLKGHGHSTEPAASMWSYDYWAHAGRDGRGANLDAPADPSHAYPARPEWYFLFLFQMLKYFEGPYKIVGTAVVPAAVGLLLFILPLLGYGRMRPFGHAFGVIVVTALLAGAGTLTLLAVSQDTVNPLARALLVRVALYLVPITAAVLLLWLGLLALLRRGPVRAVVVGLGTLALAVLLASAGMGTYLAMATEQRFLEHKYAHVNEPFTGSVIPEPVAEWVEKDMKPEEKEEDLRAVKFQEEQVQASKLARRAVSLAGGGIPAEGALALLKRDPQTRGPELFQQNCASCHTHGNDFKVDNPTASDLAGFGSKEWILGLLRYADSPAYFGRTKLKEMGNWVRRTRSQAQKAGKEAELEQDLDAVATWLASHPRPTNPPPDDPELAGKLARGFKVFQQRCLECHTYNGEGTPQGPDLTGYGDADWLRLMIMAPDNALRYPDRNAMPAFRNLMGPGSEVTRMEFTEKSPNTKLIHLSDLDRELIIRWLLKEPQPIFGGVPIVLPEKR
ncbi:MAG TPA: cytochrome b N-terminal domain-containing protein [Gemmataceae bacterium]|nr:cytochrome b N-terminal domain-containing protein [Gemmataceae bacterium]